MTEHKSPIRWWVLLAVTAIALYLCWLMVEPFVGVLGWATVLVIVFYPIHKRLTRATARPSISALLSCILVIITILAPVVFVTIAVLNELSGAMQNVNALIATLLDPNSPVTGPLLRWASQYVDINNLRSEEYLLEQLRDRTGLIAGQTLGLLGGVLGTIVQIFFVIFTMYYLFRDGDKALAAVRDSLPLEDDQADAVMLRTQEVIGASVYGVFVIAIVQGSLGALAFWVLGLPSPLVWGVVMTFLSMIPMVGAFLVWIPAAIYLAVSGEWIKAIVLVAWGSLVIGTVDNVLRPKLVGSRTRLHELLIFFSVLGGLKVFGVLGLVLGPVVLAIALALVEVFRVADRAARDESHHKTVTESGM